MPEECVVSARGLPDMELASDAKTDGAGDAIVGLPIAAVGGLILFSFCRLQWDKSVHGLIKKKRRNCFISRLISRKINAIN